MADSKQFNLKDVSQWRNNMKEQFVQNDKKIKGADFLSSETMVLFAGPAEYSSTALIKMVPIGLVQNFSVSMQKQQNQIFEIGSPNPYFIPGKTMIGGSISRVLFDGPSLMYAMYMREKASDSTVLMNPVEPAWSSDKQADRPAFGASLIGAENQANLVTPQPNYYFNNLASSYFNVPTGLGVLMFDNETQPYGGYYLEGVYLNTYSFGAASQQTVLMEQVAFRCTKLLSIDITSSAQGTGANP